MDTATDSPLSEARLRADLATAIKAGDKVTVSTLRLTLTAITNAQTAGKTATVFDADGIAAVVLSERKRRIESAEAFDAGGRPDRAATERAEADVLARYLPAPLSEDEVRELVAAAIATLGATGPAQMGQVIKEVRSQAGSRADGALVASLVKAALGA